MIRRGSAAVAGLAIAAAFAVSPTAAARADTAPPALPSGNAGDCTGPSPVTVVEPPPPLLRFAPQQIWPVTRGAGVVVAVLDTGVAADVAALRGAVLRGSDLHGGAANRDCAGRGTALAGLIAARPVDGSGFAGLAPAVTILPVRVTDEQGRVTGAALATGIRAAADSGAQVILVATGVPKAGDLAGAVAAATRAGALGVASVAEAGRSGTPVPATYPAALPDVLAVGDVTDAGPVAGGARIDLVASTAGGVSIAPSGSGHYAVSGSAVAAAYVAASAALVKAYHPLSSGAEVRRRLLATARVLPATTNAGPGLLDPYSAATALAPRRDTPADVDSGVAPLSIGTPPRPPAPTRPAVVIAVTALLLGGLVILVFTAVRPPKTPGRLASGAAVRVPPPR